MKHTLNRFDRYSFYYLAGLSPMIIGFMIWATMTNFVGAKGGQGEGLGWDIFGWLFVAWFLIMIYLVTKMLFSRRNREAFMTKLAGVKERDERESVVAGSAAKFSMLSTLALLLFLFLFSSGTMTVTKNQVAEVGKNGAVTIGFGMEVLEKDAVVHEVVNNQNIYKYKGFPLSKAMMILILIFWQIGSYHLMARKELKE
jgi:hypothetical protein